MIEFYPQIKFVHVLCVILSGSLFALRGMMMLARSRLSQHVALRSANDAADDIPQDDAGDGGEVHGQRQSVLRKG